MKKIFFALIMLLFLGADMAYAYPVFSSALGGGGYARRGLRRSVYRPSGARGYVAPGETLTVFGGVQKVTAPRKKIVIKFEPGQVALSEDQMEKLMPMMRRIQDGKVKTLEVIGICRNYNVTSHRQMSVDKVLHSYSPNLEVKYREISGPAVVNSNDNTMEFVEYW